MDVQGRLASLRLQPWHRRRDLAWPASSAGLLGAAASGVAARSTTALSTPSVALACRWRSLDLTWAHDSEAMAKSRVMSKLNRCASLRVVELVEHGAHSVLGILILGHLTEEDEVCPLQASATQVESMTRLSGTRRSTMETSEASCSGSEASCSYGGRRSGDGRMGRGESPPPSSPRAITSTMAPRSLLSLQLEPPSLRGSKTSVTSSEKGFAT
jgi:hypothetical protein